MRQTHTSSGTDGADELSNGRRATHVFELDSSFQETESVILGHEGAGGKA